MPMASHSTVLMVLRLQFLARKQGWPLAAIRLLWEKGGRPTTLGVVRPKTANVIGLLPVTKSPAWLSERTQLEKGGMLLKKNVSVLSAFLFS
jgi:hypothetical protein